MGLVDPDTLDMVQEACQVGAVRRTAGIRLHMLGVKVSSALYSFEGCILGATVCQSTYQTKSHCIDLSVCGIALHCNYHSSPAYHLHLALEYVSAWQCHVSGMVMDVQGNYWNASHSSPCGRALEQMESQMGDINPYDVLEPCFYHKHQPDAAGQQQQQQTLTPLQQVQQSLHKTTQNNVRELPSK